jgi:hypothetical protein
LIIAVVALREGMHDLVKASITGSIIGNTSCWGSGWAPFTAVSNTRRSGSTRRRPV